ncbi:MAG TPA: H-type lectin domain-containing protein, partial [Micromonospora sp.]
PGRRGTAEGLMPHQEFDTTDVLKLELETIPEGALVNLIENTHGLQGGYGWVAAVGQVQGITVPANRLRYTFQDVTPTPSTFYAEDCPIGPSHYASARFTVPAFEFAGQSYKARFEFFDVAGDQVGAGPQTAFLAASATPVQIGPHQAPATATVVRLRFDHFDTLTGGIPDGGDHMDFTDVALVTRASNAVVDFGTLVQPTWVDVLGPSHSVKVVREALNVGTLDAVVLDADLDPATADTIRPGRGCRLLAYDGDTWEPIFTGKTLDVNVTYDLMRADEKRTRIALTAVDNIAQLASVKRPYGVREISWLRGNVLPGCRVPWVVNGSQNGNTTTIICSVNENNSALDQIALTRDSKLGYAWVDRHNRLIANDAVNMPLTSVTLDEDDYSSLDLAWNSRALINHVLIKAILLGNPGDLVTIPNVAQYQTTEHVFGPYTDAASVHEWGARGPIDGFTVHGKTISESTMKTYAEAILAANANPEVRANNLLIPIRTAADIAPGKALLELYDLVNVLNAAQGLDQDSRVTALEHSITGHKWTVRVGFDAPDSVAAPLSTPPSTSRGVRQRGASVVNVSAAVTGQVAVVFPISFSSVPKVVTSMNGNASYVVTPMDVTTTGFTAFARHINAAAATFAVPFDWIAEA